MKNLSLLLSKGTDGLEVLGEKDSSYKAIFTVAYTGKKEHFIYKQMLHYKLNLMIMINVEVIKTI